MDRLHIFAGHFGSGKTEVALNFTKKLIQAGKPADIVDMDTVNPYFRTVDAREKMEKLGARVIASPFAGSNVDMPTVPADILSVFENRGRFVVFDVGGDDDGAYALGQYKRFFEAEPYSMHLVANARRAMTCSAEDFIDIIDRIEYASRLKFTDIYNNTNIGRETSAEVLMSGMAVIDEVSRIKGLPVAAYCGTKETLSGLSDEFKELSYSMEIQIKMPWDISRG